MRWFINRKSSAPCQSHRDWQGPVIVAFFLIASLESAMLNSLYAQVNSTTSIFTTYDFDIVRNYLFLKGEVNNTEDGCFEVSRKVEQWDVTLEYVTTCNGWGAIHVRSDKTNINYFINHEQDKTQPDPCRVTILTSAKGESTDSRSIEHFLWLISEMKLDLLQIEYADLLYKGLASQSKSQTEPIEGAKDTYSFTLEKPSKRKRVIMIMPNLTSSLLPYRLRYKLKTRRVSVQWQYLRKESSDDFFFKHFSEEVLRIVCQKEKLIEHLSNKIQSEGSRKAQLQATMINDAYKH